MKKTQGNRTKMLLLVKLTPLNFNRASLEKSNKIIDKILIYI